MIVNLAIERGPTKGNKLLEDTAAGDELKPLSMDLFQAPIAGPSTLTVCSLGAPSKAALLPFPIENGNS